MINRYSFDINWAGVKTGKAILMVADALMPNWYQTGLEVDSLMISCYKKCVNTLRPRQNGRHFANDIFKWIFVNEDIWISMNISLEFIPKDQINNIPALVQIMAWCRPGGKPLSAAMIFRLSTHICATRPQWVNVGEVGVYMSTRPII